MWREFSTIDLKPGQSVEAWRRFVSDSLIGVQCEVKPSESFDASFQQLLINDLSISHIISSPHHVTRSQHLANSTRSESLLIMLQRKGCAQISHRGVDVRVNPGNAFVFDPNHSHEMTFESSIEQVLFSISRTKMINSGFDPEDVSHAEIPCDHKRVQCADSIMMALCDAGNSIDGLHAYRMLDVAADVMVDHLKDTLLLPDGRRTTARRLQALSEIKTYIEENLCLGSITPEHVATQFEISRRYLDQLFEDECTTAAKYITLRRIARAAALLSAKDKTDLTISAIAYDVGFNDLSYFNRQFKNRYGVTPKSFRQA